jgi:hypothetical protein
MVFGKLFAKSKKNIDFQGTFNEKEFLVETIFDLIDYIDANINFKEAVVGERKRMKYYRTDSIVKLFTENKGTYCVFVVFKNNL